MGKEEYKGTEFECRTATMDGVTQTWADWCEAYGIERNTVYHRLRNGYTFEHAIKKPPKKGQRWWSTAQVTVRGETHTPDEWLKISGLTRMGALQRQYRRGMTIEEAISTPKKTELCDTVTATIDGVTRTIREWCRINGTNMGNAVSKYRATGDAVYAVLPYAEKLRYRREHNLKFDRSTGDDKYFENTMALHPTPEVVEMCTNCPYEDCISTITRCLAIKRRHEAHEDNQF